MLYSRSIGLDCRGHGKSDRPHDPSENGPERANDIVRLLDYLRIEKPHLIGYSMGAFVAGKVVEQGALPRGATAQYKSRRHATRVER